MKGWHKSIAPLLLGATLGGVAEPVEVIVAGVDSAQGAERIRQRLPEELGDVLKGTERSLRRVNDVWMVRLGPLERRKVIERGLLERLGRRGYHPLVIPVKTSASPSPQKMPRQQESSRILQWALWGGLGTGLFLFLVARGRSAGRLNRDQQRLEESQHRLEEAMKREGEVHG